MAILAHPLTDTGIVAAPWYATDASVSIAAVSADNACSQGELIAITQSGYTETITSVTFGATACTIVSQTVGTQVSVRTPLSLASGTYTVTVSGATETAEKAGVVYSQTHQLAAPFGAVDDNSIADGQQWASGSYLTGPSLPSGMAFISPYTSWASVAAANLLDNDIADYVESDEPYGYTVAFDSGNITQGSANNESFTITGGASGYLYSYTISSSGGGASVTGSGTMGGATHQVTGIDLSPLIEGELTLEVQLTRVYPLAFTGINNAGSYDTFAYTVTQNVVGATARAAAVYGDAFGTAQSYMQSAARAVSGEALTYNGDLIAWADSINGDSVGTYNERMIRALKTALGSSSNSLPQLMAEAAADRGVSRWQEIGSRLAYIGT